MSVEYDPVDVWWESFVLPKDGETWNFATVMEAVCEKLADNAQHLKLHKASLDEVGAWTATQTFATIVATTATLDALTASTLSFPALAGKGIEYRREVLGDLDSTLTLEADSYRIPAITGNRVYNLAEGSFTGQRVRVTRSRSADAHTATVKGGPISGEYTICVFDSSKSGWIEVEWVGSSWVLSTWGGDAPSSLLETV